ncbi:MAG TPA: hypothetical protein VIM73_22545 [Polyangiaceae bacterium]
MFTLSRTNRWRWALTFVASPAWAAVGCAAEPEGEAPVNRDEERIQAKVSACLGLDVGESISFFLPSRLGGVGEGTEARDCVRTADTCAAVKACGGYSVEPCVPGTYRCEEDTALNCRLEGGGLEARSACAGEGNHRCSVVSTERDETLAICHGAPCTSPRCDGAVLVHCVGGWEVRENCARDGRTCFDTEAGPLCSHADACTRDTCRGDELRLCAFGRVLLAATCGEAVPGSRCVETHGSADCVAITARSECSESAPLESWCEGDIGVTCTAGVRSELDCAVLDGGRCLEWQVGDELDASRAGCRATASEDIHATLLALP